MTSRVNSNIEFDVSMGFSLDFRSPIDAVTYRNDEIRGYGGLPWTETTSYLRPAAVRRG